MYSKLEYVPCSLCNSGLIKLRDANCENNNIVDLCSFYIKFIKIKKLEFELEQACIPLEIINYDIKSYIGNDTQKNLDKFYKFILEFKTKFRSIILYFHGINGTQKTTISHYIGRELILNKNSVKYLLMNDLTRQLMKYHYDNTNEDIINELLQIDCLILDECFDPDKVIIYKESKYQLPVLVEFLKKRIEIYKKNIIFISNLSIQDININIYGKSIIDLLLRNTRYSQFHFMDGYWIKDDFQGNLWD